MNLIEAVLDCYGCRVPDIPADSRMRSFPIDQFRFGFLLNAGDRYVFGCWSDGDIYYFDGEEWQWTYVQPARPIKQEFNRMIVECARGLVGRGEELNTVDAARLALAVQQVEASS